MIFSHTNINICYTCPYSPAPSQLLPRSLALLVPFLPHSYHALFYFCVTYFPMHSILISSSPFCLSLHMCFSLILGLSLSCVYAFRCLCIHTFKSQFCYMGYKICSNGLTNAKGINSLLGKHSGVSLYSKPQSLILIHASL